MRLLHNQETCWFSMTTMSCASCTAYGLAPVTKAIQDAFDIEGGLAAAVHIMTASRPAVDGSLREDRRGGRASGNAIPSPTGTAKAVARSAPG